VTKANPEVVWLKLKVEKFCHVLITELGRHSVMKGIK
jgi:hypothetical protein